jgi:hypothetical protein
MSLSNATLELELLTAKGTALANLLARNPDTDSPAYKKEAKKITQIYKRGVKALKAANEEEKDPTEHQMAIAALNLKKLEYSKVYKFATKEAAKAALRALADDWVTSNYGEHGGNPWCSRHGGPRGCFMIKVDKQTKEAILSAADTNDEELPDDMPGAQPVEEESDDEDSRVENEAALALLIVSAGVSLGDLKEMDEDARTAHAAKCASSRAITAIGVASLAEKMGCPNEENTKGKRLEWVFNTYIQ